MGQDLKFQDNNHLPERKDWEDIEWVRELFEFLQGELPETIQMTNRPRLKPKTAFNIIWYLQEHMRVIPDHIEKCDECGELFDSWSNGYYSEKKCKHTCSACTDWDEVADEEEKAYNSQTK